MARQCFTSPELPLPDESIIHLICRSVFSLVTCYLGGRSSSAFSRLCLWWSADPRRCRHWWNIFLLRGGRSSHCSGRSQARVHTVACQGTCVGMLWLERELRRWASMPSRGTGSKYFWNSIRRGRNDTGSPSLGAGKLRASSARLVRRSGRVWSVCSRSRPYCRDGTEQVRVPLRSGLGL